MTIPFRPQIDPALFQDRPVVRNPNDEWRPGKTVPALAAGSAEGLASLFTLPLDLGRFSGNPAGFTAALATGNATPLTGHMVDKARSIAGIDDREMGAEAIGSMLDPLAVAGSVKAVPLLERLNSHITGLRKSVAETIAPEIATERRLLERAAMTDELTGLGNARAFRAAQATADADPSTAVVMFDANNFGKVNKIKGQSAGDQMIQAQARAIQQAAQEYGVNRVFRLGGDEMMVLAPKNVADAIRARSEILFGEHEIGPYLVSLSGKTGATTAEADAGLQMAKGQRKARLAPENDYADRLRAGRKQAAEFSTETDYADAVRAARRTP